MSSPAFARTGWNLKVTVNAYMQGKLYVVEFLDSSHGPSCWYLIKVFGMDEVRPTADPRTRGPTSTTQGPTTQGPTTTSTQVPTQGSMTRGPTTRGPMTTTRGPTMRGPTTLAT